MEASKKATPSASSSSESYTYPELGKTIFGGAAAGTGTTLMFFDTASLICLECVLLVVCECANGYMSPFAARKLVHSGILLLELL